LPSRFEGEHKDKESDIGSNIEKITLIFARAALKNGGSAYRGNCSR
jgi:hypothetical protein